MGLSRYGERDGVVSLLSGLFETASTMDMRLSADPGGQTTRFGAKITTVANPSGACL